MGFTAYDNTKEWILDPTYGDLVIKQKGWGTNPEDGSFFRIDETMDSHICTREELGLEEDRSQA